MCKRNMWFVAVCSGCSKRNQLEVQVLGKPTTCQFCNKQFKATGVDSFSAALEDPLDYWIRFTEHGLDDGLDSGPSEFGGQINRIGRTPR